MHEKLLNIQQELKAPKNQFNEFGNFRYRSCEDIFEAVKPLLLKNELTLTLEDELYNIGERYYVKATAVLSDGKNIIKTSALAREEASKKGMDGSQITGASSSYARKYALNGLFLIDDVRDSDTTNNEPEINAKEEAEAYILNFGKHSGETLKDIYENDERYINWLFDNEKTDKIIKHCISLMTGKVELTEEETNEMISKVHELNLLLDKTETDREKFYEYYEVSNSSDLTIEQLDDGIEKLKRKLKNDNE